MGLFNGGIASIAKRFIPAAPGGAIGQAAGTVATLRGLNDINGGSGSGGGGGGATIGASGIPKFQMRRTEDFMKNEPNIKIGGPDGSASMARRFNQMRERVTNQSNVGVSTAADAMKRRFAAMGASNSGAQIKAEQQLLNQAERDKADQMAQVDIAESEALQNQDLAQADMDFKNKVFSFDKASKMHELDLAERQQQIASAQEEYNAQLNEFLNRPQKKGFLSNMLDGVF